MNIFRKIKISIIIASFLLLSVLYFNNYPIKIVIGSDVNIYTNAFFIFFTISLMILIRFAVLHSSIIIGNIYNKIKNIKFKKSITNKVDAIDL